MSNNPTKRPKRPKKYHKRKNVTIGDSEIEGLKQRPDGRYYSSEVPTQTFGKDPAVALLKFQQWDAERQGETVTLTEPRSQIVHRMIDGSQVAERDRLHDISGPEFWQVVRERILADPFGAAKKTGLPLDRLASLPKPKTDKTLTLAEVGEIFREQKTYKHKREMDFSLLCWKHFREQIGKSTVDKIHPDDLARYHRWILSQGYSPRYIKNVYNKIPSFLNHAVVMRKAFADILEEVKRDFRKICKPPKQANGFSRRELEAIP